MRFHDQHQEARIALESGVAAVEKIIRDRDVESHIAQLRLERLAGLLDRMRAIQEPSDALIVDMLSAFYGEERNGWSMGKVRRMRAALASAIPGCPQPCKHLSADDAREGRTCSEHPCTCPPVNKGRGKRR